MPYKFRQSQVLAPSRRMVPELAQARDLLRAQLADLSSTGRGLSQSESYRALVVVESLVNEAHHSSPQDLAALGRRIGKILGRAPGQTLSIADAKAIRAAARPFQRGNPLVKHDATRTARRRKKHQGAHPPGGPDEAEESAFEALPPIRGAAKLTPEPPPPEGDHGARAGAAPPRSDTYYPGRKPRRRRNDIWDDMVLAKDAEDVKLEQELKRRDKVKKQEYLANLDQQRQLIAERQVQEQRRREQEAEAVQAQIQAVRKQEADELRTKQKKQAYLRVTNAQGLEQRQKVLDEERDAHSRIEAGLVAKAREDEERARKGEERKRARRAEANRRAASMQQQQNAMREEAREHERQEELRINAEAIEMANKREQEREAYLQSQKDRMSRMMEVGGAAVQQTDQREKDEVARAERLAALQVEEERRVELAKRAKQAQQRAEMNRQLDAQIEERKRRKAMAREEDCAEAARLQKELAALDEEERRKSDARRLVERQTQGVVLQQIRSKFGTEQGGDQEAARYSLQPNGTPAPRRNSAQKAMAKRRAQREVMAASMLEEQKYSRDTFVRPPPGVRPTRHA